MDQLQTIINKMTYDGQSESIRKRSAFFQIKFLDFQQEGSDEVMIIILDIS